MYNLERTNEGHRSCTMYVKGDKSELLHYCMHNDDTQAHFKQKWQAQWNVCPDNKLFQINPTVGDFYVWTGLSHREEKVITRARTV